MYYQPYHYTSSNDRFFPFFAPFLLGGLGGYALGAVSRPRPYVITYPMSYQTPYSYPSTPMPYPYYGAY